jgi:hypothetical protein
MPEATCRRTFTFEDRGGASHSKSLLCGSSKAAGGSVSGNDILDSGVAMARIGSVRVVGANTLEMTWTEGRRAGRKDIVDLSPALGSYKIYRPLRHDHALFSTAHLAEDGDVIAWDVPDLEMTADLIETLAEETMTSADFAQFLKRNHLTQEAAAALLGRSRRQIGYYLSKGPIPRVVALACFGYEACLNRRRSQAA